MQFIIIFTFCLIVYGISNTIVFANGPFHIFKKMHTYLDEAHPMLAEASRCMICTPWWVAMFISSVNLIFFSLFPITPMNFLINDKTMFLFIIFFDGAIGSGINWLIHTLQEALERSNNGEEN